MGFRVQRARMDALLREISKEYDIYAPKRFAGGGAFSGTDCVRYGIVSSIDEVEFGEKSQYSSKEILTPLSQTILYFTENEVKEADAPKKGAVIFLRSCDLHALKRLDDMYLRNGPADYYYERLRSRIKIILMGCDHSFENCFCVSMGTNVSENYDLSIDRDGDSCLLDCRDEAWEKLLNDCEKADFTPDHVTENLVKVHVPENLTADVAKSSIWRECDSRCVGCGRCNFACPTCTCFTMQDLFYSENGKAGERRRVMASCMVDGFTNVAGGGSYRQKLGDRMRSMAFSTILRSPSFSLRGELRRG